MQAVYEISQTIGRSLSVSETLSHLSARIKRFVLLYKELDADDDELTRTRTVRRAFVERFFQLVQHQVFFLGAVLHLGEGN